MDSSNVVDVTWSMAARVWWSLTWRTIVFIFPVAIVFGIVMGIVMAILDVPLEPFNLLLQLLAWIVSVIISIWIIKTLLSKRYSNFRVTVVRYPSDANAE